MCGQLIGYVRMFCGTFEKHVLEQVSHTGFAIAFHARTYEVGGINGNGRFRLVGEQQYPQAIG